MKFGKKERPKEFEKRTMTKFAWLPTECLVDPDSFERTITVWLETYEEHQQYVPDRWHGDKWRFVKRVALFTHFR